MVEVAVEVEVEVEGAPNVWRGLDLVANSTRCSISCECALQRSQTLSVCSFKYKKTRQILSAGF